MGTKKATPRSGNYCGVRSHGCSDKQILAEFERGCLLAGLSTALMLALCVADWMAVA